MIAIGIEQKVANLETKLADAQTEIAALRAELAMSVSRIGELEFRAQSESPSLFAPNAPAMEFAKALCAEIFPGPLTIEVGSAPDDPSAQWYVFLVRCAAEMQESLDRELEFGRRLVEAFPEEAGDIRLLVLAP